MHLKPRQQSDGETPVAELTREELVGKVKELRDPIEVEDEGEDDLGSDQDDSDED